MRTKFTLALIAVTQLGSLLAAQRTWIVDASNRSGTDFTDLPAALTRASDGDTLRVRAGTYTSATTGKALTVLGEGDVFVNCARSGLPPTVVPFHVSSLAAGKTLVLRGITFRYNLNAGDAPILRLSGNRGRVHLEDCTVSGVYVGFGFRFPLAESMSIVNSSRVSLNRCSVIGAMNVAASTVNLTDCSLDGRSAGRTDPFRSNFFGSSPALWTRYATMLLTQCKVAGGGGASFFNLTLQPSAGIVSLFSDLVVAGDSKSSVSAGSGSEPRDAIDGSGGNLLYDVRVQLKPSRGGHNHSGFGNAWGTRIPSLTASAFRVGSTGTIVLRSQDRHLFAAMLGAPGQPTAVGSLGQLWVHPSSILLFAAGQQGATEQRTISLPIPNDPALRGRVLAFQALSETTDPASRNRAWKLSTPAQVAID